MQIKDQLHFHVFQKIWRLCFQKRLLAIKVGSLRASGVPHLPPAGNKLIFHTEPRCMF